MIDQIRSLQDDKRGAASIAALTVACLILSISHEYTRWFFIHGTVTYVPDLISAAIAVFLMLPIVRGNYLYSHRLDGLTVVALFLTFYMVSGFAKIGIGDVERWLFAPGILFSFVVIALANFRPDKYGELAVIACAVFGVNVLAANKVLGFWGFLLILSAFVGVLLLVDIRKVCAELLPASRKDKAG